MKLKQWARHIFRQTKSHGLVNYMSYKDFYQQVRVDATPSKFN